MLSQLPLPSFADIIPNALSHEIFERSVHQQSINSTFYTQRNNSTRPKSTKSGKPKPSTASTSKSPPSSPIYCKICDKEGHLAKRCWTFLNLKKKQSTNLAEAFVACSIPDSNEFEWYSDSGATSHLTNNPKGVDVPAVYSSNERVMVGNGQSLSISHTGSLSTLVPQSSLFLSNVLVVPGIKKKLISISQLTKDNNCCVIFSPSGFTIQDRVTRVVLGVGRCENGLYVLHQNHHALASIISSNKSCVSVPLWHARLGHPSFCTINSLSKSGFISFSNKLMGLDSSLCVGCNLGNNHCLPFSLNNNHCHFLFDCLHYDLWGPSPVCSLTGFHYYVVFIDDYTRFS